MKRIMAVTLALIMALSLAGCAGVPGITAPPAAPGSGAQQAQAVEIPDPGEWLTVGQMEGTQQLIDSWDVLVAATGLRVEEDKLVVDLEVENTTEEEATFAVWSLYAPGYGLYSSVNGYELPCYGDGETDGSGSTYVPLAPGETAQVQVWFELMDLYRCGITEVADIRMALLTRAYGEWMYWEECPIETSLAAGHDFSSEGLQAAMDAGVFEQLGYTLVFDELGSYPNVDRIVGFTAPDGRNLLAFEFSNYDNFEKTFLLNGLKVNNTQMVDLAYSGVTVSPEKRAVHFIDMDGSVPGAAALGELARVEAELEVVETDGFGNGNYVAEPAIITVGDESVTGPAQPGEEIFNAEGVQIYLLSARTGDEGITMEVMVYCTDESVSWVELSGEGATINGNPVEGRNLEDVDFVYYPSFVTIYGVNAGCYEAGSGTFSAESLSLANIASPADVTEITAPVVVTRGGEDTQVGTITVSFDR